MKKILPFALLVFGLANLAQAQFYIKGATVTVNTGATLFIDGNLQNTSAGKLTNKATINLTGDWLNSATVTQSGTAATVIFSGEANALVKSGAKPFYKVELQKSGASLYLSDAMSVNKELRFGGPAMPNSFVLLGNFSLTLAAAATVVNASPSNYIVTNGTGFLKKTSCATFTFPVGANSTFFNPVTIVESGTKDVKSVRCLENALAGGSSGAPLAQGVADASWQITESAAGGSNANVKLQWTGADELANFDNSNCALHRHSGTWSALTAGGAAAGADPFTRNALNVNTFGYFMVGTPGAFFDGADDRTNFANTDTGLPELTAFPNPASDWATLRTHNVAPDAAGVLLDARGSVLQNFNLENGSQRLDLRDLPAGIYFVKLELEGGKSRVCRIFKS